MNDPIPSIIQQRLQQYGQQHLLRWWDELDDRQRRRLVDQIETIDFTLIERLFQQHNDDNSEEISDEQILPASQVVRLPQTESGHVEWSAAAKVGEEALADGKVAAILVAGGQGTRLGFPHPKGMFPIGPVSNRPLFRILVEQLLARSRRAGVQIPYYIMTSDATHDETLAYFKQHGNFGLESGDVAFFRQGNMPALDKQTGRILLEKKDSLALSPDGHGGMLAALARSGLLDDMRERGIEFLDYHQVDNPTAIVCDPTFLGFHILRGSEFSTKVVAKRSAKEKMGVAVEKAGKTQIVEYIHLPKSLKNQTDEQGRLAFWAGSTAIHVFSRAFLDRLIDDALELPIHLSEKKVPFVDERGEVVSPSKENACKFERFIFDALAHAQRALVVEVDRKRQFNPVKNAEGDDSPASSRTALTSISADWLNAAGAEVPDDVAIEISPLFALDAEDVKKKITKGRRFEGPIQLD